MKVTVSEEAWKSFLRRAKSRYPLEHVEALWGEETIDSFRIVEFRRLRLKTQKRNELEYDDIEIARQKWLAEKAGLKFLGTIHTHPHKDYDSSPSSTDHIDSFKDGERMMGVVHLYKGNNGRFVVDTKWWIPQNPLEFELLPE